MRGKLDLAARFERDAVKIAAKLAPGSRYSVGGLKRLLGGWRLSRYRGRYGVNAAGAVDSIAEKLVGLEDLEPARLGRFNSPRWRGL